VSGSKIQWTDVTWNPVRGCSRVSEGCRNCYAERMAARFCGEGKPFAGFAKGVAPRDSLDRSGGRRRGWTGRVELIESKLAEPLKWRKPQRVFISMSDLFHETLPDEAIDQVFAVMALAPRHTFQILTKRAERLLAFFDRRMRDVTIADAAKVLHTRVLPFALPSEAIFDARRVALGQPWQINQWPLPNVWLGVSCEDQATADARIPQLLQTPAALRFVSLEPLLGPIDLRLCEEFPGADGGTYEDARHGISWVIVGGESGPKARPCDVSWIRSIRDQCKTAGVPCFVKQLGTRPCVVEGSSDARSWALSGASAVMDDCGGIHCGNRSGADPAEWPEDVRVREFPEARL